MAEAKDTTALEQAVKNKAEIERAINELLNEFNRTTGLAVSAVDIERVEITQIGDEGRVFQYRSCLEVIIP